MCKRKPTIRSPLVGDFKVGDLEVGWARKDNGSSAHRTCLLGVTLQSGILERERGPKEEGLKESQKGNPVSDGC